MSYRNERKQHLTRQIGARFKDLASVAKLKDKDGKPRSPKDIARISRAIQVDVAYMQRELAALDQPGTGLSYLPAWLEDEPMFAQPVRHAPATTHVGFPRGRVCLLPYHEAVDRWYQGRRLMGD